MYILEKSNFGTQISMLGFFGKFKELPGATFLCFEFSTWVPKNGPKNGPKVKKMPKNDQNHFHTSRRSYIRTKAREKFLF